MRIVVLYFAAVRDLVAKDEESIDLPTGIVTVDDLSRFLGRRHPPLDGRLGSVRFARNEVFAEKHDRLEDGDVVALIPPVAGGS
jgi:molybdopterin converting factor subunit 1